MIGPRQWGRTAPAPGVAAAFAGFLLASAAAVLAQTGPPPGATLPDMPPPAEAVIDTAVAVLDFSELDSVPVRIHTVQDTVAFGDLFHLVLDYPEALDGPPEIPLAAGGDWLIPEPAPDPGLFQRLLGRGKPPEPGTGDLPPVPEGTRLIASYRIYRTQPFLVQAASRQTGVIQVAGRVEGTGDTAPIRSPRRMPWSPWILLGLLAFLALVLAVARLLWNRGRDREGWSDRELPPPAWLSAAIELRDLLAKGFLNRGDSRPFLDGLAAISRRFVAGRYRIAAQEMTGGEITAACRGLGHLSPQPGVFARLIDSLDNHRYDPESPSSGWCRDQAILFFREMGRVRVLPRYTEVPAGLAVAGETAWKDLGRELAAGSERVSGPGDRGGTA